MAKLKLIQPPTRTKEEINQEIAELNKKISQLADEYRYIDRWKAASKTAPQLFKLVDNLENGKLLEENAQINPQSFERKLSSKGIWVHRDRGYWWGRNQNQKKHTVILERTDRHGDLSIRVSMKVDPNYQVTTADYQKLIHRFITQAKRKLADLPEEITTPS